MTPAIRTAEKAKIAFTVHEYEHRADAESFGLEAAAALGLDPRSVFKTLVARLDGTKLVMALVPVSAKLNLKSLAAALGAKKAEMADPAAAERATGYVVGDISPLGGKKPLPAVIDESATELATIYVSAGKRGLQISLASDDLIHLIAAKSAAIALW